MCTLINLWESRHYIPNPWCCHCEIGFWLLLISSDWFPPRGNFASDSAWDRHWAKLSDDIQYYDHHIINNRVSPSTGLAQYVTKFACLFFNKKFAEGRSLLRIDSGSQYRQEPKIAPFYSPRKILLANRTQKCQGANQSSCSMKFFIQKSLWLTRWPFIIFGTEQGGPAKKSPHINLILLKTRYACHQNWIRHVDNW